MDCEKKPPLSGNAVHSFSSVKNRWPVQTITFYAYKGGTGRTLALANAAIYLARLKQRVFAIDLDLEAPGLHHKLALSPGGSLPPIERGVVDCIHAFAAEHRIPVELAPYTIPVPREEERDGPITLMPAGNVLSAHYWRQLARLNWHELFYSEEAEGIPFFLELKERIKAEFSPDFLLIDARTGITEVGGVATTLLPDQVVCLLLNNRENLEGAREVLRGIRRVAAEREKSIGIVPVLARIPGTLRPTDTDREQKLKEDVRAFLCAPSKDPKPALALPSVFVLHAEESLAYQEALRIGGSMTVDQSPLLRDYLHLFAQIIPSEQVEPHLDRLIEAATKDKLLENPDRVQSDLEALAIYCPHPASYLALLKFYRLRNAPAMTILQTAIRYWEVSHRPDHPLLQAVVREHYRPNQTVSAERIPHLRDFAYAVWESSRDQDSTVALRIVDHALADRQRGAALNVLRQILAGANGKPDLIVACIDRLTIAREYALATSVIQEHSAALADDAGFQVARASLVAAMQDSAVARTLFESQTFRPAIILARAPHIYLRILQLAGRQEELAAALQTALESALASPDDARSLRKFEQLLSIGSFFAELGQLETFRTKIKGALPGPHARRLLDALSRHGQRSLFTAGDDEIAF
jgi:MinD-like ATPase involved in chromosome partitioning or flagellar assembly